MATVTKTVTSKGEVRYRFRAVIGHRPDGTAKQVLKTFSNKKEGAEWAAQVEADISRGTRVDTPRQTVGAYLSEWLERARKRVRPTTVDGYDVVLRRYVLPSLGGITLRDLTPVTVQRFIDGCKTPDIAHRSRRTLHIAIQEAMDLGLLATNPVARTKAPPKPPSRAKALTAEQAGRFLEAARQDLYAPYWHLAVYTGLRPSELVALCWSDVDLDHGVIHVTHARACAGNRDYEGPTKSGSGVRTLTLPPGLVTILRAHKARQNAQRLLLGEQWKGGGLVCTGEGGAPLRHQALPERIHALCKRAGVPSIRPYDLRHTAGSVMAAAGAGVKAVSEVLGHADPVITMRTYIHADNEQRDRAMTLLANALDGAAPQEAPEGVVVLP